jgi:hypothetical protein
MLGGQIPLRNCDEAGKPRLGSQEVIDVRIESAFVAAIAYGEELAVLIEQKAEFHRCEHGFGEVGYRSEAI